MHLWVQDIYYSDNQNNFKIKLKLILLINKIQEIK